MRKKPNEDRWDQRHIDMIGGVPWRTHEGDADADGEKLLTELRPDRAERMEAEEEKIELSQTGRRRVSSLRKGTWISSGIRKAARGARRS